MNSTEHTMPSWLEAAWMQRYLARELTAEESEWFEVYALDKPALLAQIEADLDLRDAMVSAGNTASQAEPPPQLRSAASDSPGHARRRRRIGSAWIAQAAAVAVSVSLGWFAATTFVLAPEGSEADVVADPVRIVFDTQRGQQDAPLLFNADSPSRYLLVEVAVPLDATDIQLLQDGRAPIALSVTSEGFVTFLWPRAAQDASAVPSLSYRSDEHRVTRPLDFSHALKGGAP